ncbi:MAG: PQQ-binding-like beta-propeller repeat protein [Bacteroidetes bacterium]|nr:PQQ-binding-like beta-propeller repeat protein [Bacteroidota bacterium]
MNRLLLLLLCGCGTLAPVELSQPVAHWSGYGGDVGRTHAVAAPLEAPVRLLWRRNLKAGLGPWSAPVIIGPYLGVCAQNGEFVLFRWADGRRVGARSFGRSLEASPATDGDRLYVPVAFGSVGLIAYELASGRVRWRFGEASVETPPLYHAGRLWLSTVRGGLRLLDPETGALLGSWDPQRPTRSATGPVWTGAGVAYATLDGGIYGFDEACRLRWRQELGEPIVGALAARDGWVWAGTSRGLLVALCAERGVLVWRQRLGPEPARIAFHLAVDERDLVVGIVGGPLWVLDPQTGRLRWRASPAGGLSTPLLLGSSAIWASGFGGELLALDRQDGAVRFRLPLSGLASSAAYVASRLFVLTESGDVLAFGL